jgi:hypothetical protein
MNTRIPLVCVLGLASALGATRAEDRADLDPTQVVGNRELPKVLYIVPWKKPVPGELKGKPVDSVLDEVLKPVDKDVFKRQLQYGAQVQAKAAPAQAAEPKKQ